MAKAERNSVKSILLAGAAAGALIAAEMPASAEVGVAAAVNQDARGTPPGASPRVISLGQNLIFNERVATDPNGQVQILLLDGSTFTVGPNSNLTIDEFVFDPNTGNAKVAASVTKGAFRFIGAKTSQTPDGVAIDSPVGTIGVRGGSVVCSFNVGGEMLCMMPFGKGVDITDASGQSCKLFKPGWLCAFDSNGNYIETRKATPREIGMLAAALAGKGNGGAVNFPDDNTVAGSDVPNTNSNLPNTIPISVLQEAVKANPLDDEVQQTIDQATRDTVRDNLIPASYLARVLTSPAVYNGPFGPVTNPGGRGLVGSPGNNPAITLTLQNGRLVGGGIDLPDLTGNQGDNLPPGQLATFDIGPGGDAQASVNGNSLEGVAYAGIGDFAVYFLGQAPGETLRALPEPIEPVFVIVGTPTGTATQQAIMDDGNIRRYTLTTDPIQNQPAPFFNADAYGPINTSAATFNSTDLYVVEGNATNSDQMTGFQSWVSIEGTGPNQKSAVGVNVGAVTENEDGQLAFNGTRGGSYRTAEDGYSEPHAMQGAISSQAGGSGGHVFGPDANHMVIGNDQANSGAFYDDPLFGGGEGASEQQFGTQHVAALAEKTPQAEATRVEEVQTRRGFMGGIAVSNVQDEGGGSGATYIVTSAASEGGGGGPNLTINKDPVTNQFSAQGRVYDASYGEGGQNYTVDSLGFAVGNVDEGEGGISTGDSSYVDEAKFGATQNRNLANSQVNLDVPYYEEEPIVVTPTKTESYMVSGRANPIPGYSHCTCAFIDWGWWGTTTTSDANGDDPGGVRTDSVHMGTWVAGDISNPEAVADLDLPLNAKATYSGTVLGTVSRQTGDSQVTEYQAKGDLYMEYDFGDRNGYLEINNFDAGDHNTYDATGYDLHGDMYDESTDTETLFGGDLYGWGDSSLSGHADGAIVDDNTGATPNVAAGVIGNFNFTEPGVASASGTFAGERGANTPGSEDP